MYVLTPPLGVGCVKGFMEEMSQQQVCKNNSLQQHARRKVCGCVALTMINFLFQHFSEGNGLAGNIQGLELDIIEAWLRPPSKQDLIRQGILFNDYIM